MSPRPKKRARIQTIVEPAGPIAPADLERFYDVLFDLAQRAEAAASPTELRESPMVSNDAHTPESSS